jgi:sterol desaturase/sphingolipid hydroxylase (fatty acid hydroxylase superfamily)
MGEYTDPTVLAVPFFIATVLGEAWLLDRFSKQGRRDFLGYQKRDAWASLAMGLGSLVFVSVINFGVFALAKWLWRWRLVDLGAGVAGWLVAMIGWDFAYYWNHRAEHENRLLWACHVNHHSSRYFNLTTALRQPWTPFSSLIFYPGLALVGVRPWMIMFSGGLNLIYQYWVHTETIGKLPAWFEWLFNTPSHHRVHHGSNRQYLDRNYAGILIIWDRLFGTFEPERERVVYGLTKNIDRYHPFYIAFHEYAAIARDMRRARGWRRRIGILWHGPQWDPA